MSARRIRVFNGDADGVMAAHQLRLAEPGETEVVTGTKRDIALLARVHAVAGDRIDVLDISFDRNRADVDRLLAAGATLRYFDHHFAGAITKHPRLETHIDEGSDVCTSALVDAYLQAAHRLWAIAAAYGDNLPGTAQRLAASLALAAADRDVLQTLGEAVNYNSYGETLDELAIDPAALYAQLAPFADPRAFAAEAPIVRRLIERREEDLARAEAIAPIESSATHYAVVLPNAPWSRRVLGTFAHRLATRAPARAHAVLTANADGSYAVSLRAPTSNPQGAGALARRFGGGGRAAAAGIDALPATEIESFLSALRSQ